jgi:hypothetical protein
MTHPDLPGRFLVYVGNANKPGKRDEETCPHENLITYTEDGDDVCGCRDCGAIWETSEVRPA